MCDSDFLKDVLARVRSKLGDDVSDADLANVEADIRFVWGGDRVYIGKTEGDKAYRRQRDIKIYREYMCGERVKFLARRHAPLSERRIRQIIQEQKKIERAKRLRKK